MVPPYGIVPDRATRDLQLGHLPGELRIVAQVPNAGQQRLMTKEAEGGQPDGIGCDTGEDRDPSGAGRHRADRPACASHPPTRQGTTCQRQHDKLQRRGSQLSFEWAGPRHPFNDRARGNRGAQ